MFLVKEHYEFSDACFERDEKPENRDLCICADFNTLPSEYGKGSVRIVMDGMSNGDGKEAVELAAPVLLYHLAGRMMSVSRELAQYIEDCLESGVDEETMWEYVHSTVYGVVLEGLRRANRALYNSSCEEPYCTVSVAVVFHRRIYTANMGDSPIYLLDLSDKEPELKPLFTCDNIAAEMIASGALTEETALYSPYQSKVRRFLGYKQYDMLAGGEIHFMETPLPQSGILLLGSDGALSQLLRREMAEVIRNHWEEGLAAVKDELLIRVGDTGSTDDFTLVMDWIEAD